MEKHQPNKTEENRPMMRMYMRDGKYFISGNTLTTDLLMQEGAENAELRHNLSGNPYISFGTADRYKTEGEMEARNGYRVIKTGPKRLGFSRKKLILDILDEFELSHDVVKADLYLQLKSEENTDPDAVLDFAIDRVAVIEEEGGSKKQETSQENPVPKRKAEAEKPTHASAMESVAVVDAREGGEDTSDIWMKVLYTDNGFVIRDDVGIMTSKECVGDELGEVLSKELGSEILGEIEHIDELKVNGFKNSIGWKVSVHIEPIEYGQFFEN